VGPRAGDRFEDDVLRAWPRNWRPNKRKHCGSNRIHRSGIMGKAHVPQSSRGHSLVVYDGSGSRGGAGAGAACGESCATRRGVLTSLSQCCRTAGCRGRGSGTRRRLEGARKGSVVVDMSPSARQGRVVAAEARPRELSLTRRSAAGAKPSKAHSPSWRAANRKCSSVLPILEKLGSSVTLTGPVGAGNVTKLANQIMVAQHRGHGEALVLGTRRPRSEVVFNAVGRPRAAPC
jgi:2-hydroxy-3-oxopropionate reductase